MGSNRALLQLMKSVEAPMGAKGRRVSQPRVRATTVCAYCGLDASARLADKGCHGCGAHEVKQRRRKAE